MKRVLHLIKKYKRNSPLLNEYVGALPSDRFHSVVCYLRGQSDGRNEMESVASEVIYLGYVDKDLKHLNLRVISSLYKMMRQRQIDIVHCHGHKATVIGTIGAKIAGVPSVISHVHGLNRTRSLSRYITNWFLFKGVKKIIAVSDSVRNNIIDTNRNLDPSKVITVRNGINIGSIDNVHIGKKEARSKYGISDDSVIFGTVGRLAETKGQKYLIEAYSQVKKKIPNSKLVIIGNGPLSEKLKKDAEAFGISKDVIFMGYRTDVLELLKGLDIFVFPSIAEGLPLALLEAMASRLPIIASNVGGIPEVFGNSNCGILVPPRDSQSLANAMIEIGLLNESRRKDMGESSRKRVEDAFTTEIMCKNLMDVYEALY